MKEMKELYQKNMNNLNKASARLLKQQKEAIMDKSAKFVADSQQKIHAAFKKEQMHTLE